jgi:hypothetical protein
VRYRNTLNTRVGVRVRYTDADLENEQDVNGIPVDNDYEETEISGVFYWEGSAKSSLEARLGYTDLKYKEFSDRDYQGTSGRLTYRWVVTGKTRINIDAWQETSTQQDEITTYVLTRGMRIRPIWSVTRKITLLGEVTYYNDDYKGSNDFSVALGGARREDDIWIYGIRASWSPRDWVKLSLGYRNQNRDSTVDSNDFDDQQIDARVRFEF